MTDSPKQSNPDSFVELSRRRVQDTPDRLAYAFLSDGDITKKTSATYRQLYPPLLSPALWSERGNVPALVRLLHAYLRKGSATVVCAKPENLTG